MAQIKVLDLCNSNSLSELSNEDAQKVSGGAVGLGLGVLVSAGDFVTRRSLSFTDSVGLTAGLTYIGSFYGPVGASLSS